jgi:hypothetical protein
MAPGSGPERIFGRSQPSEHACGLMPARAAGIQEHAEFLTRRLKDEINRGFRPWIGIVAPYYQPTRAHLGNRVAYALRVEDHRVVNTSA